MSTTLPPGSGPRVGTLLRGKYRLDRVIGAGGMAVVYKATHRNHAEFAVKMLHAELSVREDIRGRFVREGYAANAVKHPGAVLVVDDDVAEDGAAFLVMELLDGVSCDHLWSLQGPAAPVELTSAVAIQLLDVLAAAHEKGILHRDIKPANIFLTRAGLVKVLDFGIARTREAIAGAQTTATGLTLGTPAFMAPEHARGRSREMDGRTDVWAVGATFFAMVSGQLVHQAETANELLIAAGTKPARSLAATAPGIPVAFAAVIDRALAFEKADRWQSAAAMRDALSEAHRTAFGHDDVQSVVAAAAKDRAPAPEPPGTLISPAAETRTFPPVSAPPPSSLEEGISEEERRLTTKRMSTSAAISNDRDAASPRPSRWAVGVGALAIGGLAFAFGFWASVHRGDAAADAGHEPLAAASRDGMVATAPRAEATSVAILASAGAPASAAPLGSAVLSSGGSLSSGGGLADGDRARVASGLPPTVPTPRHVPLSPVRSLGADAGAAPATCNPPWFFDSVGHKQYKPECF